MPAVCPICFEGDDKAGVDAISSDESNGALLGSDGEAPPSSSSGSEGSPNGPSPPAASDADATPRRFLIRGRYCSHGFRKPCLEAMLLVSPGADAPSEAHQQQRAWRQQQLVQLEGGDDEDAAASEERERHAGDVPIVGVPTQGSCPICRARLSLFDVRWLTGDCEDDENVDESDNASNYVYEDEISTDWRQTPLAGKVYVNPLGVGSYSFHFDDDAAAAADAANPEPSSPGPYVNIEVRNRLRGSRNGHPSVLPLRQFQWHGRSNTMRSVMVDPTQRHVETIEFVKSFAPSHLYERSGVQITHWATFSCVELLRIAFPLDGTLRVSIVDQSGERPANEQEPWTETVRVVANRFVMDHRQHVVRGHYGDNIVHFLCPDLMGLSWHGRWGFVFRPEGPRDGDSILCPLDEGGFEKWTMLRRASGPPPSQVTYSGPFGELGGRYRLPDADPLPVVPPRYHGATLHGNVFIQNRTLGLASYHFSPLEPSDVSCSGSDGTETRGVHAISAYISYESPSVALLAPMDDGSPPPSRVSFRDASFDPTTRTFTGSIRWLDEHGTTWQHMGRWDCVMRFDAEFTCIVGGNVTSYDAAADAEDEGRELARYGEHLSYANAALSEYFREPRAERADAATPPRRRSSRGPSWRSRGACNRRGRRPERSPTCTGSGPWPGSVMYERGSVRSSQSSLSGRRRLGSLAAACQ
jgi:hypothetical protein